MKDSSGCGRPPADNPRVRKTRTAAKSQGESVSEESSLPAQNSALRDNAVAGYFAVSPCQTRNTACYEEMFSEPPRLIINPTDRTVYPALLSRPGNTYSNFNYFWGGFYLLAALLSSPETHRTPFFHVDMLYAVVLLSLAVFSVLWHSSHYNKVHTLDLATMDYVIGYTLLRLACLATATPVFNNMFSSILGKGMPAQIRLYHAGILCFVICSAFLFFLLSQRDHSHGKNIEFECPFSGRRRVVLGEIDIIGASLYLAMPVIYLTIPTLLTLFVFPIKNDTRLRDSDLLTEQVLVYGTSVTLAIGWCYRYTERFCLDGNPLMRLMWSWRRGILEKAAILVQNQGGAEPCSKPGGFHHLLLWRQVCIAGWLWSPTAVLHWMTGFTVTISLAYCRHVEQNIMALEG